MQELLPASEGDADEPLGKDLIAGRPAEDWSFELVEVAAGASLGLAIGTAVAGPVGTVVGGMVGAAAGMLFGEGWETAAGRAATTTDATEPGRGEEA